MPRTNTKSRVTPDRETTVRIDTLSSALAEPSFAMERQGTEICASANPDIENVVFVPGVGWSLETYQSATQFMHEQSVADSSVLQPGANAVGAGLLTVRNIQKQLSDYNPMVGGGYGAGVRTSGDKFWQLGYPAGTTTPSNLSADQSAHPSPDTSSDNCPMDRLLVGNDPHSPDQPLFVRFQVPAVGLQTTSTVLTVHFAGPAGKTPLYTGTGKYALKVYGNGMCWLWELSVTSEWQYCTRFQHPQGFMQGGHMISIFSDAQQAGSGWTGRTITFQVTRL